MQVYQYTVVVFFPEFIEVLTVPLDDMLKKLNGMYGVNILCVIIQSSRYRGFMGLILR